MEKRIREIIERGRITVKYKQKYNTVEELVTVIEDYFNTEKRKSVTGLCLHLGFSSRGTLNHHCEDATVDENGNPKDPVSADMVEVYRWAKLRVENYYEEQLMISRSPAGPIFALKNMGWKDNQEVKASVTVTNIAPIEWVK